MARNRIQADVSGQMVDAVDYPLYVVTARAGDEISGCLAGFVTQASIEPVRFLVCISRINHTFRIVQKCEGMALHLLGSEQEDVASLFGEQTGDVVDKFASVDWSWGATGAPVLSACRAWVEGQAIDRMSAGDHDAFLMTVSGGGGGTHAGRFMMSDASSFEPGHPE